MVKIEQSLCIGCAKCVKDCVSGVLHIDQGKAAVRESCMQCGHCVAVCPVKAVSIPEYDMADVAEYDKDSFTYTPECFLNAVKFRRSIRSYKAVSYTHLDVYKRQGPWRHPIYAGSGKEAGTVFH